MLSILGGFFASIWTGIKLVCGAIKTAGAFVYSGACKVLSNPVISFSLDLMI